MLYAEHGEEQLLLRHVPAAIAWRETVGVPPSVIVDAALQRFFHTVGSLFGDDTAYGISQKHPHHVVFFGETLLEPFKIHASRGHKEGEGRRAFQLPADDAPHLQLPAHGMEHMLPRVEFTLGDEETELRADEGADFGGHRLGLLHNILVGQVFAIPHLFVEFFRPDVQLGIIQNRCNHRLTVVSCSSRPQP